MNSVPPRRVHYLLLALWLLGGPLASQDEAAAEVSLRLTDQDDRWATAVPEAPQRFEVVWDDLPDAPGDEPCNGCDGCGRSGSTACGRGLSNHPGWPRKPCRTMPGDVDRGANPPYRYTLADCQRAGWPHSVARWAKPSINRRYSAWFVGGGAAIGGRGMCPGEGTWGLDYHGWFRPGRVWMGWTFGRKQGGEGAYKTDGRTGPLARH